MTPEEEAEFTVVDKRRTSRETEEAPAETQPTPAPASSDPPRSATDEQETDTSLELPRLSIRDRLLMCIDILNQGAWIGMGLIPDPATGEVEQDLDSARLAIDSVAFLAEKVAPELDDKTRRELKSIVSDLQINYVQQSKR